MRALLLIEVLLVSLSFFSLPGGGIGETNRTSALIKATALLLPLFHLLLMVLLGWKVHKKLFLRAISNNRFLVAFAILGIISVAWSPIYAQSLIRALSLLLAVFSIISISIVYQLLYKNKAWEAALRDIQLSLLASHLAIFFAALVMPEAAFKYSNARLGGEIIHPNTLGGYAMISVLFSLYNFFNTPRLKLVSVLTLFCAVLILFLTFSRNGLLTTTISSGILIFTFAKTLSSKNFKVIVTLLFITGLTLLSTVIIIKFESIVNLLSRGESLAALATGNSRTLIWSYLIANLDYQVWFGNGYSMLTSSGALGFTNTFETFHAHNGYIQVLCGLGITGLGLFFAQIYKYLSVILHTRNSRQKSFCLVFALIVAFLMHNLAQSSIGFQIYPHFFFSILMINMFLLSEYWPQTNKASTQ